MRVCNRCGTEWHGYGYVCNSCKQIERLDNIASSSGSNGSNSSGGYSSGGSDLIGYLMLILIGWLLSLGDFALLKFLMFFVKIGFFLCGGWLFGMDIPHL